jgi:hypothetical protein
MNCPRCGTPSVLGDRLCRYCGWDLAVSPPPGPTGEPTSATPVPPIVPQGGPPPGYPPPGPWWPYPPPGWPAAPVYQSPGPVAYYDHPPWFRRLKTPLILFALGLVLMAASHVAFAISETQMAAGFSVGSDILTAAAWLFFALAVAAALWAFRRR